EELPHLAAIQAAVWADRRLCLDYQRSGATESLPVTLDPYGLVSKGGTWYLVAAAEGGRPRLYRVSRVSAAEVLEEPSRRPPNLDLEALWEELRRGIEERGTAYPVRVRVRAERADMLLRLAASQLQSAARRHGATDGWETLELEYVADGAARASMLAFADVVEVLEQADLRTALREAGEAVARLYRS
ncbi:MAG: WYL domain-containing protein, partial [Chloroflexota bacterium]